MPNPVCHAAEGETIVMPWNRIVWTASHKLGNSSTMTFGRATMGAGQKGQRHRHPNCDEVLHVLSGRIVHSLGAESYELGPGDTISIPAGEWHGAEVLGDEPAELVIVFSSAEREVEFEPVP